MRKVFAGVCDRGGRELLGMNLELHGVEKKSGRMGEWDRVGGVRMMSRVCRRGL